MFGPIRFGTGLALLSLGPLFEGLNALHLTARVVFELSMANLKNRFSRSVVTFCEHQCMMKSPILVLFLLSSSRLADISIREFVSPVISHSRLCYPTTARSSRGRCAVAAEC